MDASKATGRIRPARHLCIWPKRQTPRALHVPEGRTLHILDFENLCGGPEMIPGEGNRVTRLYGEMAGIRDGDHVVMGANPMAWVNCVGLFAGSRFVGRPGPDGADEALLEVLRDVGWIAERYDRVVIGSGDHAFTFVASQLTRRGIMVGLVAREGSVSSALARAVGFVRVFPQSAEEREAA